MAPRRERFRVCLIGPECTGKTMLAAQLAEHFHAPWIPEFAREYAERVMRPLTADDVEPIARGELALLDAAPGEGLTILDTDLLSTVVYSRYYYRTCPTWIEHEALSRRADLYLLMDIDVPWQPDQIRDTAGAREALREAFESALVEFGTCFTKIGADWATRLAASVREISSHGGAEVR